VAFWRVLHGQALLDILLTDILGEYYRSETVDFTTIAHFTACHFLS
jgi:hypothetical protein